MAVIGLSSSIFFAWQGRKHNKMSVEPRLDFTQESGENLPRNFELSINNYGLGPGLVEEIQVIEKSGNCLTIQEFKNLIISSNGNLERLDSTYFEKGTVIGVNDKKVIFNIQAKTNQDFSFLVAQFLNIEIKLTYTNFYKDKRSITFDLSRALKEF